jgi:hypothetical protein
MIVIDAKYHREWYHKNKTTVLPRKRKRQNKWVRFIRHIKDEIKLILGCVKCGYAAHPRALDFHHRDHSSKDFEVSTGAGQAISLDTLLNEISKCDVICANCHRILTHEERLIGNSDSGNLRPSEG